MTIETSLAARQQRWGRWGKADSALSAWRWLKNLGSSKNYGGGANANKKKSLNRFCWNRISLLDFLTLEDPPCCCILDLLAVSRYRKKNKMVHFLKFMICCHIISSYFIISYHILSTVPIAPAVPFLSLWDPGSPWEIIGKCWESHRKTIGKP